MSSTGLARANKEAVLAYADKNPELHAQYASHNYISMRMYHKGYGNSKGLGLGMPVPYRAFQGDGHGIETGYSGDSE